MTSIRIKIFIVSLLFALPLFFTACDIGLGSMVNTQVPVIKMPEDGETGKPGSFFEGTGEGGGNRIWLDIKQDYGMDEVWLFVEYNKRPEFLLEGETNPVTDSFLVGIDPETGMYFHDLDVSQMEEGQIKTWVVAKDITGNTTTTPDMIYTVKNKLPQVELSIPRLVGDDFDKEIKLQMITHGGEIMGIATDLAGIEKGYPQIMIWYEGFNGTLDEDNAAAGWDRGFGQWHTMTTTKKGVISVLDESEKAVQFRWPLYNLQPDENNPGKLRPISGTSEMTKDKRLPITVDGEDGTRIYNFKIRVKDIFGRENIYPYRTDFNPITGSENQSEKIAIELVPMTNPIISMEPIPYYNGDKDFIVNINIQTDGVISKVRAAIHTSTNYSFPAIDNNTILATSVNEDGIINQGAGDYEIIIPVNKMPHDNDPNEKLKDGEYFLHVEAIDTDGKPGYIFRSFTIDDTPPSLQYIQPVGLGPSMSNLPEVTSMVTFQGLVTDNYRIKKMYYILGKTEVEETSCELADCGENCVNNCYWLDTYMDEMFSSINKPVSHTAHGYSGAGSTITARWEGNMSNWRFTFPDISDVTRFPAAANHDSLSEAAKGNYYVYHTGEREPGTIDTPENMWILPVKFKVVDEAGNVRTEEVRVIVDPEADRPKVFITSHEHYPNDPLVVGGEVRISGTAEDNDWVNSVWIRVYKADNNNNKIGGPVTLPGTPVDGWWEVDYQSVNKSPNIGWNYTLNRDGSLDPPEGMDNHRVLIEMHAKDSPPGSPLTVKSSGRTRTLVLIFSNTVPRITKTEIIWGRSFSNPGITAAPRVNYTIGDRFSDCIILVATIEDDQEITSIEWQGQVYSGVPSYEEVINNTVVHNSIDANTKPFVLPLEGKRKYELYLPLDTKTIRRQNPADTAGWYNENADNYTLSIKVADNNTGDDGIMRPQVSTVSYTLQIDNYAPFANFSANKYAIGNRFTISGSSWDREPGINVNGVERVVVYFSRPAVNTPLFPSNAEEWNRYDSDYGSVINLWDGKTVPSGPTGPNNFNYSGYTSGWVSNQRVMTLRKNTGPSTIISTNPNASKGSERVLTNFPDVKRPDGTWHTTNSGIVISGSNVTDGYSKNFSGDPDVNWRVDFDTTRLNDGYVFVNYVVFDKAENASYYKDLIYIANNRPKITGISLGTDIDGVGGVTGNFGGTPITGRQEYKIINVDSDNKEIPANFRIRNNSFVVRVNTATAGGTQNFNNNRLRYRVAYVSAKTTGQASITKGAVYAIENTGTDVPWVNYGVFDTPTVGYVFVATADAALGTTARVTRYDALANENANITNTLNTTQAGGSLVTSIPFNAASFAVVPDSNPKTAGEIDIKNQRMFIVKVFDDALGLYSGTLPANMREDEQLSFASIIALDIDNTDAMAPKLRVAPFGQEHILSVPPQNNPAGIVYYEDRYEDKELKDINITGSDSFLNETEYRKNIVIGNVYGSAVTERKGYVQYDVTAASLSGKVIFTGRAGDNLQIGRITVQIGGSSPVAEFTIAQRSTTTGLVEPAVAANTITAMSADNASMRWGFEAAHQNITLDFGHVLDWKFAWDSSQVPNQTSVPVTFRVYDVVTGTGNTAPAAALNVNVVPYITEIKTQLSDTMRDNPSTFNRSATGWYPVREGETIEIKGFNFFTGSGTYAAPAITVGGTALTGITVATGETATLAYRQKTHYTATVGSAVNSGALILTANTAASINNNNKTDAASLYNFEPNRTNNNKLTDDRYLYVWDVGYLLNQKTAQFPIMRMNSNGTRYIIYSDYLNRSSTSVNDPGQMHIARDNKPIPIEDRYPAGTIAERTVNRYVNLGLAIDEHGNWYAGASNITSGSGITNYFAFHARGYSGAGVSNAGANTANAYQYGGANKRRLLTLDSPTTGGTGTKDSNRVRLPRFAARTTAGNSTVATDTDPIARDTTATRVFLSYYDENNTANPVVFQYGLVGQNITFGNAAVAPSTAAQGTSGGVGGNFVEPASWGTGGQGLNDTGALQQVVANNTTTHRGSMYTAVGGLSNGRPVVAWYDRTNQRLVFSYGGSALGTGASTLSANTIVTTATGANTNPAAGTWQGNAVVIQSSAGTHVDLAVDEDDNVHLAYYDVFNGGLHYAFIPSDWYTIEAQRSAANIALRRVKVDTYLSAGTKIMINVRRENHGTTAAPVWRNVPYISYFHSSFAATKSSIRVAWPKDIINSTNNPKAGSDANDRLTGDWEVMTVPAQYAPLADYYVCNGVPTSNAIWAAQLPSGSALTHNVLDTSILVGYMTTDYYEGAVLKHRIFNKP